MFTGQKCLIGTVEFMSIDRENLYLKGINSQQVLI